MPDREKVIRGLECCSQMAGEACRECPYANECEEGEGLLVGAAHLAANALSLIKEQEPRELTKEEWEQWKKDERRDPICMIWYGDTTPFWVLMPELINEPLYLMGRIKLFTKKPPKEQVKWDEGTGY